jgi:hypothetical protein
LSISNAGIISGNPSVSGDFNNVAISVSDSFNPVHIITKSFLMHISGGFQVDTLSLPDAVLSASYAAAVSASGGKTPYTYSAAGLPSNLVITSQTGTISGTPQASGDSNVTFTVTDSSSPVNSVNKNLNLHVSAPLLLTTTILPRSAVEAGSLLPAVPGWVIGIPYTAAGGPVTLLATGGTGPYHWSATGLPHGLSLSDGGVISGTPDVLSPVAPVGPGYDTSIVTVRDSATPQNSTLKTFKLKIYKQGDASGDNFVNIADVTFLERVILGLNAPTAGCDANLVGGITIGDVTKIERIILGLQ